MKTFLLLISLFTLPFTLYPFFSVRAENMESDSYKLNNTNLNMTSGEKSSENFTITDTVGQTGSGKYSSNGFIVKAGFQYVYSAIPFTFSISKSSITFANLAPSTPVTDSLGLKVTSGASHGYKVTIIADNHLKKNNGVYIPETSCDDSTKSCTVNTANIWNSLSSYGFGYSLSGDDIPTDFKSSLFYKPFALESEGFKPSVLMSNSQVGRKKEAVMSLKLNVSNEQETGQYQNTLKFVAIPSY